MCIHPIPPYPIPSHPIPSHPIPSCPMPCHPIHVSARPCTNASMHPCVHYPDKLRVRVAHDSSRPFAAYDSIHAASRLRSAATGPRPMNSVRFAKLRCLL